METGKRVCAPVHISSAAAQTEKRMDVQAPLTAVYVHTVPALPAQPYPQLSVAAAARESAMLHLTMPPLYSKETLPFLTLHIAGGLHSPPGPLNLTAAAPPTARPKSSGKHVCPHCGRDCMKPSVLEKHLRCHTGERPYPCTTCGVSFKTQSNLYKHKRTQAHARLSSESEQSSLGSIDSMSSSRETHTSSLSLDEESGSTEKDAELPAAEITAPVTTHDSEHKDLTPVAHETDLNESAKVRKVEKESEEQPPTVARHLPLQRQKATQQWESSMSRRKSQNHESTDSGFSESSEHNPSPGSVLPDHCLDSLTESSKEHVEQTANTNISLEGAQESKDATREKEQKTLEERISKLISENSAVVEDKQLENVRPRKTVLSKQGSIDLPMPYTYKDSFHFDMKISKTPNAVLQRDKRSGLFNSVPSQPSTCMEHAPLTRSNSLPFSVTLLQPERIAPASPYQSNYVTVVRRGSSGQIHPEGFTNKPVNRQSSTHRPLVRQTAVDCNHATDGLFMNSSAEEASTSSLSYDGDGADICGEPSGRKFRRKKAQKFAYNKWYMYGGGTFKKLYNEDKGGERSTVKGRKCTNQEQETFQAPQKRLSSLHETVTTSAVISSSAIVYHNLSRSSTVDVNAKTPLLYTSCTSVKTPIRRNLSLSVLPLPSVGSLVNPKVDAKSSTEASPSINGKCGTLVPSNRKKQKTNDELETPPDTLMQPTASLTLQDTHFSYVNLHNNYPKHMQLTGALVSECIIKTNAPSFSNSLSITSTPSVAKTSFLPKYQLKLPNTAEPDVNTSVEFMDKPSGTDICTFTSAQTEQTSIQSTLDSVDSKTRCPFNSSLLSLPCKVASLCYAETRVFESATSRFPVGNRPFAATTITTTCLHDYQEGLCSKSIQPLKPAPVHLPTPVAPVAANIPAVSSITTANNHTSATTDITLSQLNSTPPSLQLLPQSNLLNRECTGPNITEVPCHDASLDQIQPAVQNVFHVQTADLQICLQIITDEQLALIEPQIERQADGGLLQTSSIAAGGIKNKDDRPAGHVKELDQCESDVERLTHPLSDLCGKPQPNMTEHNRQAPASAESEPPEAPGLTLHPHRCSHVNLAAAETMRSVSDVMSTTAAALSGGRSQNQEEGCALSLDECPEEEGFLDRGVSHSDLLPGSSPTDVSQNEKSGTDSGKASTCSSSGLDSGETRADECSGSAPTFSFIPESLEIPKPCQDGNTGCDRVRRLPDDSVTFLEKTLGDSQDVISSTHSDKQFTSESNIQVERSKNMPAVLTSPKAELTESDNLTGCAAQRKPQTQGHDNALEQSDSSEWRPKPDQDPGDMFPSQRERGHSTGRIRTDQVPAQWTSAESDSRYMVLEGEDSEVRTNSLAKSGPSVAHVHHRSQTNSGMSEYPPQSPRPAPSSSNNLNFSAGGSGTLTSLLHSPEPPLEMSHLYFPQHQWECSSSSGAAATNTPTQTSISHTCTFTTGSQTSDIKKPFAYLHLEEHAKDVAPYKYTSHDCGRSDTSNTYQSFFLAAQLQGYQQAEGSSPGLRSVQSSHDYSEDTSSSDDEGKLIIEL